MNINKVAITGHTKGIGKSLAEKLLSQYEVLGFSRGNGYDISKDEDLTRIIDETLDCEIFVNNAYHFDQQTKLAKLWQNAHKDKEHFIINVSTLASDPNFDVATKLPHLVPYAQEKQRLNRATFDICDRFDGKCKAMSILLGIVETGFQNPYGIDPTNLLEHYEDFKKRGVLINPEDVADTIIIMMESIKQNCFIYSISLLNRF
jgi:NAD(P)-dependent dehydrogenase (short-subunit alcohol dehydrogenase family)